MLRPIIRGVLLVAIAAFTWLALSHIQDADPWAWLYAVAATALLILVYRAIVVAQRAHR